MDITERLQKDYFGKSRLYKYEEILKRAIKQGYDFVSVKDFDPNNKNQVILRHDIDSDIRIARKMFKIEQTLNIKSTYYFRWSTYNQKLIDELKKYGNEVSYHFEEISTYAYKHNLFDANEIRKHFTEIEEIFTENLNKFRGKTLCACETVAAHGDFVNRKIKVINNEIITKKVKTSTNIRLEAYDSYLMDNTKYCSDGKEDFDTLCDFNKENNYYLLVHPRTWEPAFFSRFKIDTERLLKGIKYDSFCKVNRVLLILEEIKGLPKEKLTFIGDKHLTEYKYFTKPHPRYIVFQNKGIGAMLLKKPENFDEYLKGKEKQNVRTCRNKCAKKGYYFKSINVEEVVDDILEINESKEVRQGEKMHSAYFDKDKIIENAKDKNCYGVFTKENKLVSYCYMINAGDFVITSRLLGHNEYLNDGVMFFMMSEFLKLMMEDEQYKEDRYLFYDTYFGAKDGMKKFKMDLGFRPYRVRYKKEK